MLDQVTSAEAYIIFLSKINSNFPVYQRLRGKESTEVQTTQ